MQDESLTGFAKVQLYKVNMLVNIIKHFSPYQYYLITMNLETEECM